MIRTGCVCALIAAATTQVMAQESGGAGGMLGGMLPMMLVMFAIIYFLMIRPEQKKQKERQKMLSEMKKGDKVITAGGMHGVVQSVKDDIVQVKVAENIVLQFSKSSITNIGSLGKPSDKEPTKTEAEKKG